MGTSQRVLGTGVAVALGASALLGSAAAPAGATQATVTIDAPAGAVAGPVALSGTVGLSPGEVTSVLYVVDTTNSTATPAGSDCSGNGGVGAEDDLNADGSVGDVLDCEVAAVVTLNASVAKTAGLQAGLVGFANEAAAADLDPSGSASFLPPGYTGGDPRPRIETVARSVTRGEIGLYHPKHLGGSGAGTAFNNAVRTALATLASAPAGPKWIMFLSDGQAAIDDGVLAQLGGSGVKLRAFGIGADATCATSGSLYKMASVTGESCTVVGDPASLAAGLTGSQPDSVAGVTVSVKGVAVAARLNAVGGWSASFDLGAGSYTATATATLSSGATASARRAFKVAPGAAGPPPGKVRPGAGSLSATLVRVDRPVPTRSALPDRVTGVAGVQRRGRPSPRKLKGAHVLLQARKVAGDTWTTVDKDRLDRTGRFSLHWHARSDLHLLRVVLLPHKKYAGSAAVVGQPAISSCAVTKKHGGWSVRCLTTARSGSPVRLLEHGSVVGRARVHDGAFHVRGRGAVGAHAIDVLTGSKHLHLDL
jgi:hypothetical protein